MNDRSREGRGRGLRDSALGFTAWYIFAGVLLVAMALSATLLKRLPLTAAVLYLATGVVLGSSWGAGRFSLDVVRHAPFLERATEVAVIVSLFTAGLKLRLPLSERRWWLPVRLAFVSMTLTVAAIAAVGVWLLGLSPGAAVLLGAILAPTDAVLASDVQVAHPADRDRLRFGLTGEAGLNDGTAFPFAMLGLGMMGLHDLGPFAWKWLAVDVAWAVVGGLAVGAAAGTLVAHLVLYLRKTHKEAVGLDDFLSLGLLALSYGAAVAVHAYGFLAVFAAGVALRRVEARHSDGEVPADVGLAAAAEERQELSLEPGQEPSPETATDPDKAPAYMAQAVLGFSEQLERICEVAIVVMIGGLLAPAYLPREAVWFVPLLFLVIRPAAVYLGLVGMRATQLQRGLIAWFGIRGVGSLYYLAYAITHGIGGDHAQRLAGLTLTAIAASVTLHGLSVTPLMNLYERISGRRDAPDSHRRA